MTHDGSTRISRSHVGWQLFHLLVQGILAVFMTGTSHALLAGSLATLAAVGAMFALTDGAVDREPTPSTGTHAALRDSGESTAVASGSPPRGDD